MRLASFLFSILFITFLLDAQERYLVPPNDDMIPLTKGQSAHRIIKEYMKNRSAQSSTECTNQATFGYPPDLFPENVNSGARHKDVFGQWYVAKAGGTIDTIFWGAYGNQALDSLLYVRVHNSIIGPDYGPGVRPGPFAPPCRNWGHWVNTNDLDQGVAAFIEDATDTNWVSTYLPSNVQSGPPFSNEIWGLGGYPAIHHINSINSLAMMSLGTPLNVTVGQKFFISMRVNALNQHIEDATFGTQWWSSRSTVTNTDENYPSRNWKFYEHDRGASNCGGFPTDSLKRGWVARGGVGSDDTLLITVWNWWYTMTVTTNIAPKITDVVPVDNQILQTSDQSVSCKIEDCNPADPSTALVQSAVIKWSLDGVPQTDITLSNIGGDLYEGTIPGQPVGSTVQYKIRACDPQGMCNESASFSYRVISIRTAWFYPDSGVTCTMRDIRATGNTIDTSKFFYPSYRPSGTAPKDDGTAGPFDIGGTMQLSSGEEVRYAWVGINGGITLSATATDTQHLSNGLFSQYDIPSPTRQGISDTSSPNRTWMGKNFIAPYWNDFMLADSDNVCGRIVQGPYPGDTCLYVVEWDSIGWFFDPFDATSCDATTFRVVLNRCTGTIEFQYVNTGLISDADYYGLVGVNLDSNVTAGTHSGWVFLNVNHSPTEMNPRNNWCIRLYPTSGTAAIDGWNMVSVAGTPVGSNYDKSFLYPTATSNAFRYQAGYVSTNPLSNGPGYWVKFAGAQSVGAPAVYNNTLDIAVADKWNMIGSISKPVATSSISATGGTIASGYSGFGTLGYTPATTITPGKGYWVKMNGAGTLHMSAAATPKVAAVVTDLNQLNKVIIQDATGRQQVLYLGEETMVKEPLEMYELPPPAPEGFDARFTSGRMIETYPAKLDPANEYEYPIAVQTTSYPITVRWEIVRGERKLVLSDGVQGRVLGNTVLEGIGRIRITNASVKTLVIRLTDGIGVPKEFALGQNYPNPFNPITHFTIEMPKTAEVEVAIYDILGRKIVTLMSGQQAAGYHTMEWDGHDGQGLTVPSGMYFVRMNVDEFTATRKIVLLK